MIAAAWVFLGLVLGCSFGVLLMGSLVAAREPNQPAKVARSGGQMPLVGETWAAWPRPWRIMFSQIEIHRQPIEAWHPIALVCAEVVGQHDDYSTIQLAKTVTITLTGIAPAEAIVALQSAIAGMRRG